MFTLSRLIAAILLASVGFLVSELIKPLFAQITEFGMFNMANAGLGFAVAWVVIGSRIGRGIAPAISNGITAAVVLLFWGILAQSVYQMISVSLRGHYGGLSEGLMDVLRIAVEWGAIISTPAVLGLILGGSILAALVAELASRVER